MQNREKLVPIQKGLILVTGIPASGKSFLSIKLKDKLISQSVSAKIYSTDSLEALITLNPHLSQKQINQICNNQNWDYYLCKFQLNKQKFNQNHWNISRKITQNHQFLDTLFEPCEILIIQDQLALKSQRKPFKRYCFHKKIKYLEIQLDISLQQALENNQRRGTKNIQQKVSEEIIQKSFQKYEHNEKAIKLDKFTIQSFLNSQILKSLKYMQIKDNYTEYMIRKSKKHDFAPKQFDENQLRKFISAIIKDEKQSLKYFQKETSTKEKAAILAECKKIYIANDRKISFEAILSDQMIKKK